MQNRINVITEFDWLEEQGLISSCSQANWNVVMINVHIKTTGNTKD